MSEMNVSTNILLINGKKYGETRKNIKKQQETAKKDSQKPCFFVLNCWKYGFASLPSLQKRNLMSEMIVSSNILLITDKKCVETWKNSKKQEATAKNSKKPYYFVLSHIWVCVILFPPKTSVYVRNDCFNQYFANKW